MLAMSSLVHGSDIYGKSFKYSVLHLAENWIRGTLLSLSLGHESIHSPHRLVLSHRSNDPDEGSGSRAFGHLGSTYTQ